MPWPKAKPMTFEWFSDACPESTLAETLNRIAVKQKRRIAHIVSLPDGRILTVSFKGTPIKKAKAQPKPNADPDALVED